MKLNTDNTKKAKKTFVVIGSPRGGTSMIAGVLRELGIFLGYGLGENHEDPLFLSNNPNDLKNTIVKRNSEFDIWGWKVPHSLFQLPKIKDALINAHYIVIYRNIKKVAQSQINRSNASGLVALRVTTNYYSKIIDFLESVESPVYIIDYEDFISNKEENVIDLANFCDTELTKDKIQKCLNFINPKKGYSSVSFNKFKILKLNKKVDDSNDYITVPTFTLRLQNLNLIQNKVKTTNSLKPHISSKMISDSMMIKFVKPDSYRELNITITPSFGNGYSQNLNKKILLTENESYVTIQSEYITSFLIQLPNNSENTKVYTFYKNPKRVPSNKSFKKNLLEILNNEPEIDNFERYEVTKAFAIKLKLDAYLEVKKKGELRKMVMDEVIEMGKSPFGVKVIKVPTDIHHVGRRITFGSLDAVDLVEEVIFRSNFKLEDGFNALDFGCSNGRLCSLASHYYNNVNWFGCDARESTIEWTSKNIKNVNFFINPEVPPIKKIKNGFFNFVVAISIWSHFSENLAIKWFDEMARIISKNGLLVFSSHGYRSIYYFSKYKDQNSIMAESRLNKLNEDSIHFAAYPKNNSASEELNTDDWGMTFISESWLVSNTKDDFEVIEMIPGKLMKNQDVYILKRK